MVRNAGSPPASSFISERYSGGNMVADAPRYVQEPPEKPMVVEPVTLRGQYVRLEPMTMAHHDDLCKAVIDPDLWRWFPGFVKTPDEMRAFMEQALKLQAEGSTLPFTTYFKSGNQVVGMTRFLTIDSHSRHVEIGATLVSKPWQRTPVNTEAKYLMLRHAFETWGCLRVELKTDSLNERSRTSLTRLGAKEEGTFRNHIICQDGRVRHTIYFSITDEEWPKIKSELEIKLARPYLPQA